MQLLLNAFIVTLYCSSTITFILDIGDASSKLLENSGQCLSKKECQEGQSGSGTISLSSNHPNPFACLLFTLGLHIPLFRLTVLNLEVIVNSGSSLSSLQLILKVIKVCPDLQDFFISCNHQKHYLDRVVVEQERDSLIPTRPAASLQQSHTVQIQFLAGIFLDVE